jgi:pyridoxal phosphate enzyme (YggS family)
MTGIVSNLQAVHHAIEQALQSAKREAADVKLLAVSKKFPASAVREAFESGQHDFGESYVQEALSKMATLRDLDIVWHFIGPVQSNKTRDIAENFAWVHGVDRFKIAQRLSEQRPTDKPALNICLQVNVSGEVSKSGVAPQEVAGLAREVSKLPRLKLRGLMAIPAPADDEAAQRKPFVQLRKLSQEIVEQGIVLDTLSMGMSHDFVAAIEEGATIIRIGTAIFGSRNSGENI